MVYGSTHLRNEFELFLPILLPSLLKPLFPVFPLNFYAFPVCDAVGLKSFLMEHR